MVRVLLASAPPGEALRFQVNGPFKVYAGAKLRPYDTPGSLYHGYRLSTAEVTAGKGRGLLLNEKPIPGKAMVVMPEAQGALEWGQTKYSGAFQIQSDATGSIRLFNTLELEQYLAGVLFEEMPASFSEEALKAQVVAARSYALHRQSGDDAYLTADTRSQVYKGLSAVNEKSLALVEATKGEVLTYEGEVLPGYYSSTCGGITAKADDVFGGSAPAPLNHNRPCGFCSDSRFYRWQAAFTGEELKKKLGLPLDLMDFEVGVTGYDAARRATEFCILDGRGNIVCRYTAQDFRSLINKARPLSRQLLSTRIDSIAKEKEKFVFHGGGWGHGVGLCQYGAQGLAKKGRNYRQILTYYYEGAKIAPHYGRPSP
jgi:stage II sporulation protein D